MIPLSLIQRPYDEIDFTRSMFDSRVVFTRPSSASRFKANGTIEVVGSNVPRIDHDPFTGEVLGLLLEAQATNLLLNSETLSTQTVTTSAATYRLSFYGTGSITLSGSYSGTLNSAGAWPNRAQLVFTATAGPLTLTVSGNVQYAQLEVDPGYATSWIPTTTAAATRANDTATITNASWGGQVPYIDHTLYVDFTVPYNLTGYNRSLSCRKTTTGFTDAWWYLLANNNTAGPRPVQWEGLGSALNIHTTLVSPGQRIKVAATMQNENRRGCVNGGNVYTRGTMGTLPANLPDLIEIGAGNGACAIGSRFKRIRFYPWLMTNAELQQVTA
jgi:hypothetical protein